jgi:hypothetical protein
MPQDGRDDSSNLKTVTPRRALIVPVSLSAITDDMQHTLLLTMLSPAQNVLMLDTIPLT